jgi:hypothetical protein
VQALVEEAILKGADAGGFILMTCARLYEASIDEHAVRNMLCYLETGREIGNYPISAIKEKALSDEPQYNLHFSR